MPQWLIRRADFWKNSTSLTTPSWPIFWEKSGEGSGELTTKLIKWQQRDYGVSKREYTIQAVRETRVVAQIENHADATSPLGGGYAPTLSATSVLACFVVSISFFINSRWKFDSTFCVCIAVCIVLQRLERRCIYDFNIVKPPKHKNPERRSTPSCFGCYWCSFQLLR